MLPPSFIPDDTYLKETGLDPTPFGQSVVQYGGTANIFGETT